MPTKTPTYDVEHTTKQSATTTIRILHTADLHGQLHGYHYGLDRKSAPSGLCDLAPLINQQRQEADACLLFDSGDFLFGTLMGSANVLQTVPRDQRSLGYYPIVGMMNRLGYDAAALGNHEFDNAMRVLPALIHQAAFPLVISNLQHAHGVARPLRNLPQKLLLNRTVSCSDGLQRKIKIGVIGLTPMQTPHWALPGKTECLVLRPMAEAATATAQALRRQGADCIVAIAHTGLSSLKTNIDPEHSALKIAQEADVDVLLCGHQHHCFPYPQTGNHTDAALPTANTAHPQIDSHRGRIAGRPATIPGSFGSHLGQVDLKLCHENGLWRVDTQHCQILPAREMTGQDRNLIAPYHNAAKTYACQTVGQMEHEHHSFFARFANDSAVQVLAQAQAYAARNLIQGTADEHLPLISVAAAFRTGNSSGHEAYLQIPAGALRRHHLAALYPFDDPLCLMHLKGRDIRWWLEQTAYNFNTIIPGVPDQTLLNPEFPSYLFYHFLGLTYEFDLTAQPGNRVRNLCLQGEALHNDQTILTVGSSFRRGQTDRILSSTPLTTTDLPVQAALETYISSDLWHSTGRRIEKIWHFRQIGNTSALVPTVLPALNHLEEIADLLPEARPTTPTGSIQLKLHL